MGRSGRECHLLVYFEQPKMTHFYLDLGAGQKVQRREGGWAGAFRSVVVRNQMTHPFHWHKTEYPPLNVG